jgi:hypothetical protein
MGDGNFYTALLDLGFYPMSLEAVRQLCVSDERFQLSKTRAMIMENLESLINGLRTIGVRGNTWIDGSFLTEKIDPDDVDILLYLDDATHRGMSTGQKADIDWLLKNEEVKEVYNCDSHVHIEFPVGHDSHAFGQYMHAYYLRQFGWDEFFQMKGIVVVTL